MGNGSVRCAEQIATITRGRFASPATGRGASPGNDVKKCGGIAPDHGRQAAPPDGELVALDDDGRPVFNDLMFGRREPVFVPFDVLFVDGKDVRPPLEGTQGAVGVGRATLSAPELRAGARRGHCGIQGGVRPTWKASLPSGWRMPIHHGRNGGRSSIRLTVRRRVGRSCLSALARPTAEF
jgi:hypothetical protein